MGTVKGEWDGVPTQQMIDAAQCVAKTIMAADDGDMEAAEQGVNMILWSFGEGALGGLAFACCCELDFRGVTGFRVDGPIESISEWIVAFYAASVEAPERAMELWSACTDRETKEACLSALLTAIQEAPKAPGE